MEAPPRPSRPEILAEIRAFIVNWFREGHDDGIGPDTALVTSGIVDSAGVLELVEFLEERFGIRVAETEISLQNCNTLAALAALVERLQ